MLKAIRLSVPVLIALITLIVLILLWWLGPSSGKYGQSYPLEALSTRWLITLGIFLLLAMIVGGAMYRKVDALQQSLKKEEREKEDPARRRT